MTNWKEILEKLKDNENLSLDVYNLSTDEKELIEEIIRTNKLNESLALLNEIDVDKEWKNQKDFLQNKKDLLPKNTGHFKRNLFKYAAGILLPLILFSAYYIESKSYFSTPLEHYNFSYVNQSKATLILPDGSQKKLEELDSNLIIKLFEKKEKGLKEPSSSADQAIQIEYNTLIIPRGASYKIQLADGTRVHLNENTVFKFPASFENNNERKVIFEKGEVFFDVVPDNEKAFVVNVGSNDIAVLGTAFNVQLTDEYLSTTLIEGKVLLRNDKDEVILHPNQQAVISTHNTDIIVRYVDVISTIAWHNKLWVFEQQTLESIMADLTSWYNFKYEFVDDEAKTLTYTASLEKAESIENVLRLLEKTGKVTFTIKRNKIFIHKVSSSKTL